MSSCTDIDAKMSVELTKRLFGCAFLHCVFHCVLKLNYLAMPSCTDVDAKMSVELTRRLFGRSARARTDRQKQ